MVFHPEANLVEFLSAPSALPTSITDRAEKIAKEIALRLNIRGILAIEFFLDQNDEIIVNEMAPRPHNSGHHTIQGNVVSQFEQHFRSIVGWAPGDTSTVKPAVMLNVKSFPKKCMCTGLKPSVLSSENILTPINSATMAFAIKNEPRTKNRIFLLFSLIM
jgi:formate-dependent phosphoribosylglycinamide formyltransferase (GAR transformylase)